MADFVIRAAGEADIERLLEVERRAAALLLGLGTHDLLAMHSLSAQDLHDGTTQGILRVADVEGHAVGFALAGQVDGHAHLFEMDVVPGHGRRGIGTALLESVCRHALARGYPSMTLTTLRDVHGMRRSMRGGASWNCRSSHGVRNCAKSSNASRCLAFPCNCA